MKFSNQKQPSTNDHGEYTIGKWRMRMNGFWNEKEQEKMMKKKKLETMKEIIDIIASCNSNILKLLKSCKNHQDIHLHFGLYV